MSQCPFVKAPNTFFLTCQQVHGIVNIAPYESPWGMTDEMLCFVDGVLIGRQMENYPVIISLAPTLDRKRDYPWPTAIALLDALDVVLRKVQGWRLRCEQDCDQAPVEEIHSRSRLRLLLAQTVDTCTSDIGEIPNFAASDESCGT